MRIFIEVIIIENSNETANKIHQNIFEHDSEDKDVINISAVYLFKQTSIVSWKTEMNHYLQAPRKCAY